MSTKLQVREEMALPSVDYHASPGLSNSMLKDLEVSPLRFWFKHINPNRKPEEPTREMILGSALHCAVLETASFEARYVCEWIPTEGTLETIADIRAWITDKGHAPKGTKKDDLVQQARLIDSGVSILDLERSRHGLRNSGKVMLTKEEWVRMVGMTQALHAEPTVVELLSDGYPEVVMTATDRENGVLLRSKMDWVDPRRTVDVKTFTQKRGKSIDKSIADDIFYYRYYRQAYFYTYVRTLQPDCEKSRFDFVMPFVESEPPYEVRVRVLRPKTAGQMNLYWERGRMEANTLIARYASCLERFGDKPWREEQEIDPLIDDEIPALAY